MIPHLRQLVRWSSMLLMAASLASAGEPTATPAETTQPAAKAGSRPQAPPAKPQATPPVPGTPSTVGLNRSYVEDTVVVGRATKVARKNLPNAVATVKAEDLVRCPAQTVEQALQGKIVGATILSNSGEPAGAMQIRLRGVPSLGVHREPLFVVDGVLISDMGTPKLPGLMPGRRP